MLNRVDEGFRAFGAFRDITLVTENSRGTESLYRPITVSIEPHDGTTVSPITFTDTIHYVAATSATITITSATLTCRFFVILVESTMQRNLVSRIRLLTIAKTAITTTVMATVAD